jgi:hypothetical protein
VIVMKTSRALVLAFLATALVSAPLLAQKGPTLTPPSPGAGVAGLVKPLSPAARVTAFANAYRNGGFTAPAQSPPAAQMSVTAGSPAGSGGAFLKRVENGTFSDDGGTWNYNVHALPPCGLPPLTIPGSVWVSFTAAASSLYVADCSLTPGSTGANRIAMETDNGTSQQVAVDQGHALIAVRSTAAGPVVLSLMTLAGMMSPNGADSFRFYGCEITRVN